MSFFNSAERAFILFCARCMRQGMEPIWHLDAMHELEMSEEEYSALLDSMTQKGLIDRPPLAFPVSGITFMGSSCFLLPRPQMLEIAKQLGPSPDDAMGCETGPRGALADEAARVDQREFGDASPPPVTP